MSDIRYEVEIGHFCGRDGCRLVVSIIDCHPTEGIVCGTFCWPNGDFVALNNLAYCGHGPGLEKEFELSERGARIAANWFVCQQEKYYKIQQAAERRNRRQRRNRLKERQRGLKGGTESGNPFAVLLKNAA
jgi:hypothetical protein